MDPTIRSNKDNEEINKVEIIRNDTEENKHKDDNRLFSNLKEELKLSSHHENVEKTKSNKVKNEDGLDLSYGINFKSKELMWGKSWECLNNFSSRRLLLINVYTLYYFLLLLF